MTSKLEARVEISVPAIASRAAMDSFQKDLEQRLTGQPDVLALDCSQLKRVSADHISSLCGAYQSCERAGVSLRLTATSPGLARVLEVLDLDGLLLDRETTVKASRRTVCRWAAEGFRRMYVDQFRVDADDITRSSETFLCYLNSLRVPEITAFELQTVFYEIAMNIAAHSKTLEDERVVFTAEADDRGIVMAFTDSGEPFDPTTHEAVFEPKAAGKERKKRGLGITMIRRLTDKISYCRKHDSLNILKVEKHWGL